MAEKDQETRERLIQTTMEFLTGGQDPERITVRKVAERAGVGIGLINYHFQTRDNRVNEAISRLLWGAAARWIPANNAPAQDPVVRLKSFIKESTNVLLQSRPLARAALSNDLMRGDMGTAAALVPVLREIFGPEKDELSIRLMALQIITALQTAYLRASTFRTYTGIDIDDEKQRDQVIEAMVDNLVRK